MRVIRPYDEGIISENDPEIIRDYLSKMNIEFEEIQLRLLDESYVKVVKPEDFPKHIKKIKLVLLTAATLDPNGKIQYVISDEYVKVFLEKLPNLKIQVIYSPYGFYKEPVVLPTKIIQLTKGYRNLERLEEAAPTALTEVTKVELGFTDDSPHNGDREFGVFDSIEIYFESKTLNFKLKAIFDRHNAKLILFHSDINNEANRAKWIDQKTEDLKIFL